MLRVRDVPCGVVLTCILVTKRCHVLGNVIYSNEVCIICLSLSKLAHESPHPKSRSIYRCTLVPSLGNPLGLNSWSQFCCAKGRVVGRFDRKTRAMMCCCSVLWVGAAICCRQYFLLGSLPYAAFLSLDRGKRTSFELFVLFSFQRYFLGFSFGVCQLFVLDSHRPGAFFFCHFARI